jgi:uncharacterized protein
MPLTRRAALKGLLATTVGAATGTAAYGVAHERRRIGVTRVDLPVRALPPALEGLRIGFITDVHHSQTVPPEDVSRAVALLMQERPDLIALGGDYVTRADRAFIEPAADLLQPLHAPHGVFATLGNHDDDRYVPAALTRRGFTVLADAATTLTLRGETLTLAGIRFWTRQRDAIARVLAQAAGPTLLLAHDPRRLVEAADLGVAAVLAGHTHGGQVLVPGIGALVRRHYPVLAGLARRGGTSMFISRGVGTVYVPIRINCPPEVALVTLRGETP